MFDSIFEDNPRAAIVAAIVGGTHVVTVKEISKRPPFYPKFVGGRAEVGEKTLETVVREVNEEINLNIQLPEDQRERSKMFLELDKGVMTSTDRETGEMQWYIRYFFLVRVNPHLLAPFINTIAIRQGVRGEKFEVTCHNFWQLRRIPWFLPAQAPLIPLLVETLRRKEATRQAVA